jgi:hypothetical protein
MPSKSKKSQIGRRNFEKKKLKAAAEKERKQKAAAEKERRQKAAANKENESTTTSGTSSKNETNSTSLKNFYFRYFFADFNEFLIDFPDILKET